MLVYDPFMGIGNTTVACIRLALNYLGTEIEVECIKVPQRLETPLSDDSHELI